MGHSATQFGFHHCLKTKKKLEKAEALLLSLRNSINAEMNMGFLDYLFRTHVIAYPLPSNSIKSRFALSESRKSDKMEVD